MAPKNQQKSTTTKPSNNTHAKSSDDSIVSGSALMNEMREKADAAVTSLEGELEELDAKLEAVAKERDAKAIDLKAARRLANAAAPKERKPRKPRQPKGGDGEASEATEATAETAEAAETDEDPEPVTMEAAAPAN